MKIKKLLFFSLIIALVTFTSSCGDEAQKEEKQEKKKEFITILTLGDNLLHMPVIESCRTGENSFDFSPLYSQLQPKIKNADIAVIGQETVFAGEDFGYSGYPLFNSPSDAGRTLVKEGFDVVLHASNHVLDKWALGVENTLKFWDEYPEITVLGINHTPAEQKVPKIASIKGAKIALLNYTYGTNSLTLPAGKEYMVNYIDEEKIKKDAEFANKCADFTIAFMHWGVENMTDVQPSQKDLAKKMCEMGVDLIIGSHPHVIGPVEWIESENGNRMLVYYSLGNFVSRQLEEKNLLGGLADVKLIYNGEKVTIDEFSFVPVVTYYDKDYKIFTVYKLKNMPNSAFSSHGLTNHGINVSKDGYKKIVEEVFDGYDKSMIDME